MKHNQLAELLVTEEKQDSLNYTNEIEREMLSETTASETFVQVPAVRTNEAEAVQEQPTPVNEAPATEKATVIGDLVCELLAVRVTKKITKHTNALSFRTEK